MMGPEQPDNVWKQGIDTLDIPHEEGPLTTEEEREGLFFRIVRKRADYFSDVGTLSPGVEIDELPTQRYSAFLQSLGLSLDPMGMPSGEEQSVQESVQESRPVCIVPRLTMPFRIDITPATLILRAVQSASENYSTHLGNLLKRSGVYALASMVAPFISLMLAPFLTRSFARADYGALMVLNTAIALVAGISQLGLGPAFFRIYNYDYEGEADRQKALSTTLVLLLASSLLLTVLVFIIAPGLASLLLGDMHMSDNVRLAALIVLLQNLTVPGFAWMRAEGRASISASISVANLLTNLGLTLLLVGVYHLGLPGALLATACGYALVILCTLPSLLLHAGGLALSRKIARSLLAFGMPNAISFAAAWALQLADRFLLAHMRSLSETAIYSVAYTLGGALSVVVLSPFALAWPSTLFLIARRQDACQIFRLIFRWYGLFLLFMTYALSLAALFVLHMCFPPGYRDVEGIIPIVALSTMFYGLYNYLTLGMNIRKKLWYAVLFLAIAALINFGANFILIPLYGSTGAALATLLAYAVLVLETYFLNQRIYPVPFEVGLFGLGLLLTIACYVGGTILTQSFPFWLICVISLAFLLFCTVGLFALGSFWT
ncbi:MAG TPA: lipopolysaccharide biosynthesis protein, partial [Ktedonobacteraceae bacterium]|nr:lipopolysaccharide biosynthesis protein [Ktedonobacteraceae bacterium]